MKRQPLSSKDWRLAQEMMPDGVLMITIGKRRPGSSSRGPVASLYRHMMREMGPFAIHDRCRCGTSSFSIAVRPDWNWVAWMMANDLKHGDVPGQQLMPFAESEATDSGTFCASYAPSPVSTEGARKPRYRPRKSRRARSVKAKMSRKS